MPPFAVAAMAIFVPGKVITLLVAPPIVSYELGHLLLIGLMNRELSR
jgi:hypothetical protein